jgi:hypothetical protein
MADISPPEPAKPFCALLAGDEDWLDQAVALMQRHFDDIDLSTANWPFDYTDYYEPDMGSDLFRRFVSFADLIDPARIVEWKLATNGLETQLATRLNSTANRPVNLDPGYVVASKMVLATAKNFCHRIYLGRGIYAEVTLQWSNGEFLPLEWTYPDYRSKDYREFFRRMRKRYMKQIKRNDNL